MAAYSIKRAETQHGTTACQSDGLSDRRRKLGRQASNLPVWVEFASFGYFLTLFAWRGPTVGLEVRAILVEVRGGVRFGGEDIRSPEARPRLTFGDVMLEGPDEAFGPPQRHKQRRERDQKSGNRFSAPHSALSYWNRSLS